MSLWIYLKEQLKNKLELIEKYLIIFTIIFMILGLVGQINKLVIISNLLILLLILIINFLLKLSKNLKSIIYFPILFFLYTNVKELINGFGISDKDLWLQDLDLILLSKNIADYFNIFHNPFLTEILQISYFSFFILPFLIFISLNKEQSEIKIELFVRNLYFGFLFSYFLYLFIPAIGPRFVIFEYSSINSELPGLFLTDSIRSLIDGGGGIAVGSMNPELEVNRDCMPSGHTMLTTIYIYLVFLFNLRKKYLYLLFGILIIISTLYLRYHYLVDILAGFIFAIISIKLEALLSKNLGKNL